MAAPHLSGILTFVAGLFGILGTNAPLVGTPTGVFFEAVAAFLIAVVAYLLSVGLITLHKKR